MSLTIMHEPLSISSYPSNVECCHHHHHHFDEKTDLSAPMELRHPSASFVKVPLPSVTRNQRGSITRAARLARFAQTETQVESVHPTLPFLNELFVSPHPDDICYSAFGTASQGAPKENKGESSSSTNGRLIVTVFSKSRCANGQLGEKLGQNVGDITHIRRQEDEDFAKSMGCQLIQMGLGDSSARDEFSRREELQTQSKRSQSQATKAHPMYPKVYASLRDTIRWAVECRSAIYLPLGIGCHIDHMMTRVATESILEEIRLENLVGVLPSRVTYYEDLPYAFYQSDEVIEKMANTVIVNKAKAERLVPLDEELWERKCKAVRGYATQMKPTIIPCLQTRATKLAANETSTDRNVPLLNERTWVLQPGQWILFE